MEWFSTFPPTGPPVQAHAQRLPPDKLIAAKAEFKKMEEMGIIRWSISMVTDASDSGLGATLQQHINDTDQSIAFFSWQLQKPETKYSMYDRELLAIFLAVCHFWYFLEARQFTVYTDHRLLTSAMSKSSDQWSARQQRQLSYISEFTMDIQHIPGVDNPMADALSRASISAIHEGNIDFKAMAQDQQGDPEVHACLTAITGLQFQSIPIEGTDLTLIVIHPQVDNAPWCHQSWCRWVFEAVHGLSLIQVSGQQSNSCHLSSSGMAWPGRSENG